MSKTKNVLMIVFMVVLIDMLGIGILIPVIPQLLGNPGSEFFLLNASWTEQQGLILLGILTAIYPLMAFLAAPILGQLSDKYGRKKILLISIFGTAVGYILFALAIWTKNIPLLFFSRALDGITGGNISVAQAAIADISKPEERAKNFGLIGAAFGLGFIIGPFLGGKLSDPEFLSFLDATTPFWFAAILSTINLILIWLRLPETVHTPQHGLKINWSRSVTNIVHALRMKKLRGLFATSFLFSGGFTFFTTFFGVYLIRKFGWEQGDIGEYFAAIGVCIVLTQAILLRFISGKVKGETILKYSLFILSLMIFANFLPNAGWQMYLIVPVFAASNGLSIAFLSAQISRSAPPNEQGEILGINSGIQSLAQGIPALLSGFIAASMAPEASILVGAGTVGLAGLVFLFWGKAK